jgi:predicted lipid-binding transport protein (Tim44 family)
MNKKIVNEAGIGKTLGTAAALGAGLYGAKKLGQVIKNPQALKAAGGMAKAAGQVGKSLLELIAPIVKEVGPAVAKSILKQRYGIDIPDSTINAVKNAPAAPATATASPSTPPGSVPPVLPGKSAPTATTLTTPTASTPSSSTAPTKPVSPVSPTSAGLSKDLIQKIANDNDSDVTRYVVQRGTTGSGDPALASKLQKKYGLKDQQTLDRYISTLYDSVNLKSSRNIKELNEKLKQVSLLPETIQIEILSEFVPALLGAARIAGPAIGRALTSNTAKQIGKQVAVNTGVIGANSIIDKLQKKKQTQNINNNEMEELIKSKEKKMKLSSEGIGTGTLGAVAGGALGGLPGAVVGGLVGGAAPKAVKEVRGAFEGEEGKNKEKKKKKKLKESTDYVKFVYNISQKNYAEANKYLKDIIDSKLKSRIESCLDNKLF